MLLLGRRCSALASAAGEVPACQPPPPLRRVAMPGALSLPLCVLFWSLDPHGLQSAHQAVLYTSCRCHLLKCRRLQIPACLVSCRGGQGHHLHQHRAWRGGGGCAAAGELLFYCTGEAAGPWQLVVLAVGHIAGSRGLHSGCERCLSFHSNTPTSCLPAVTIADV
jgi:hypothetical protein